MSWPCWIILNKSIGDISVIIPAYNRANLIGETLRSLLNQTVQAKEIIVVDDGSQDGTADAVLEMLKLGEAEKLKISERKPWPEIKVIRQANAGQGEGFREQLENRVAVEKK